MPPPPEPSCVRYTFCGATRFTLQLLNFWKSSSCRSENAAETFRTASNAEFPRMAEPRTTNERTKQVMNHAIIAKTSPNRGTFSPPVASRQNTTTHGPRCHTLGRCAKRCRYSSKIGNSLFASHLNSFDVSTIHCVRPHLLGDAILSFGQPTRTRPHSYTLKSQRQPASVKGQVDRPTHKLTDNNTPAPLRRHAHTTLPSIQRPRHPSIHPTTTTRPRHFDDTPTPPFLPSNDHDTPTIRRQYGDATPTPLFHPSNDHDTLPSIQRP